MGGNQNLLPLTLKSVCVCVCVCVCVYVCVWRVEGGRLAGWGEDGEECKCSSNEILRTHSFRSEALIYLNFFTR